MPVTFRLAHIHRVSILSLCILLGKHAHAQVLVSTEAEYTAALFDPKVAHIRLAQGSTITPLTHLGWGNKPANNDAWILDGEVAADGSLAVFDGLGEHRTVIWAADGAKALDTIRNLVFRNMVTAHNNSSAAAIHFGGKVLNGLHNVHFEDNIGRTGGAVTIGGLAGGVHASSFRGNQGSGGAGLSLHLTLSGGVHNTQFIDNRSRSAGGGLLAPELHDGIYNSVFRHNQAEQGRGGALHAHHLHGGIHGSEFVGNRSTAPANTSVGQGGAVYVWGNFTGGIHPHAQGATRFADNVAAREGGGMYVQYFDGGIYGAVFTGNRAEGSIRAGEWRMFSGGGGLNAAYTFGGGIHAAEFRGNTARFSGGGVLVGGLVGGELRGTFHGDIDQGTTFIHNRAELGNGGALAVNQHMNGNIRDSFFIDNHAGLAGGAVYLPYLPYGIYTSHFIGNTAQLAQTTSETSGLGGAIYVRDKARLENNVFLGNAARTTTLDDTAGGLGGAVFHDHGLSAQKAQVTVAARGGKTVFYGNVHQHGGGTDSANAIHFGNTLAAGTDRKTDIVIDAAAADDAVLMFDPLSAQADGLIDISGAARANLSTTLAKTGTGTWFLGGESQMRGDSVWKIQTGTLALTTVDGAAAGVVLSGKVSEFTLGKAARLQGSGTIAANSIQLSGTVAPSAWRNAGVHKSAISHTSSAADFDVARASIYGKLTFDTQGSGQAVVMDGATVGIDLAYDASGKPQHDTIAVQGALNVSNSTIDVRGLTLATPPTSDSNLDWYQPARVITTTDGISGDFHLTVAGTRLSEVDFLNGIVSAKDGNDYTLRLGLNWYAPLAPAASSQPQIGHLMAKTYPNFAHGTFTLAEGQRFSLAANLMDRDSSINGWNGKDLTKQGAGTLVLNGASSYTGSTTVVAGTLVLGDAAHTAASLASAITVRGGATLAGFGRTSQNIQIDAGAVLAPGDGDSVGTLRAANIAFAPGGILRVKAGAGGSADRLTVSNDIRLTDGHIEVRAEAGSWDKDRSYTVIDYGGARTGEFANIASNLAFLTPTVDYGTANQVILRLARNDTALSSPCGSFNQCNTAHAVESLADTHAVARAVTGMSADGARRAFDTLAGEIYGSTRAALLDKRYLRDAMFQRMRAANTTDERLWVNAWHFGGHVQDDGNAARTRHSGRGLALGADRPFGASAAGVVLAYEDDKVSNQRAARATFQAYSLGAYVASTLGGVQVHGGAAVSRVHLHTQRTIQAGDVQGNSRSAGKATQVQVFAGIAKDVTLGTGTVTPYAELAHVWLTTPDAREAGTPANLHVRGATDRVFQTTAGVRAAVALPTKTPVSVYGDLAWVHTTGDIHGETSNRFADAGARFAVRGAAIGKNTARIAAGVKAQLTPGSTLNLNVQTQLDARRQRHAVNLKVQMRF